MPYSQNWNLTLQFEPLRNTVVEFAYVGNKGTHLYMPPVNLNPRDFDLVEALEAINLNVDTNVADPLGRTDLAGSPITVRRGALTTRFVGFNNLYRYFDPSANSIRHAGYVDVRRRVARGLTFTANYTYAKSIDDASDSSPDTRVLTTSSTQGHVTYGAPRNLDRSLSTFDIKHNFSSTFVWDVPVGRNRWLFGDAPAIVDSVLGGWTITGLFRLQGGTPFIPTLVDTNRLGGVNRVVRPDIVEGVPLLNPRYSGDCLVGTVCEPYVNPAAFRRPAKGSLGNAPRTLDATRHARGSRARPRRARPPSRRLRTTSSTTACPRGASRSTSSAARASPRASPRRPRRSSTSGRSKASSSTACGAPTTTTSGRCALDAPRYVQFGIRIFF